MYIAATKYVLVVLGSKLSQVEAITQELKQQQFNTSIQYSSSKTQYMISR